MNKAEYEKFNNILSEGFKELITLRPEKPLDHFIYFLMNSIPEHIRRKDSNLLEFLKNYQRTLQEKETMRENEEQEENRGIAKVEMQSFVPKSQEFYFSSETNQFCFSPVYHKSDLPKVFFTHLKLFGIKLNLDYLLENENFKAEMKEVKMIEFMYFENKIQNLMNKDLLNNQTFKGKMNTMLDFYYKRHRKEEKIEKAGELINPAKFNDKLGEVIHKSFITFPQDQEKTAETAEPYEPENYNEGKQTQINFDVEIELKHALNKNFNWIKYMVAEDRSFILKKDGNQITFFYEFFQKFHKITPSFEHTPTETGFFKSKVLIENLVALEIVSQNKKQGKLKLCILALRLFYPENGKKNIHRILAQNNTHKSEITVERKNTNEIELEYVGKSFKEKNYHEKEKQDEEKKINSSEMKTIKNNVESPKLDLKDIDYPEPFRRKESLDSIYDKFYDMEAEKVFDDMDFDQMNLENFTEFENNNNFGFMKNLEHSPEIEIIQKPNPMEMQKKPSKKNEMEVSTTNTTKINALNLGENANKPTNNQNENNKEDFRERLRKKLANKHLNMLDMVQQFPKAFPFIECLSQSVDLLQDLLLLYNSKQNFVDRLQTFSIKNKGKFRVSLKNAKSELFYATHENQHLALYDCLCGYFQKQYKNLKTINEIINILDPELFERQFNPNPSVDIQKTKIKNKDLNILFEDLDNFDYTDNVMNDTRNELKNSFNEEKISLNEEIKSPKKDEYHNEEKEFVIKKKRHPEESLNEKQRILNIFLQRTDNLFNNMNHINKNNKESLIYQNLNKNMRDNNTSQPDQKNPNYINDPHKTFETNNNNYGQNNNYPNCQDSRPKNILMKNPFENFLKNNQPKNKNFFGNKNKTFKNREKFDEEQFSFKKNRELYEKCSESSGSDSKQFRSKRINKNKFREEMNENFMNKNKIDRREKGRIPKNQEIVTLE